MNNFTKEDLINRGWIEETDHLLKSHVKIQDNIEVWNEATILRLEKSEDFQANLYKEQLDSATTQGKNFIESLNIDFNHKEYLIGSKNRYNLLEPIYHIIKKGSKENFNTAYTNNTSANYMLFTDGAFKIVDNKAFASCGGWIINKHTKEVIVEFSMALPLDASEPRNMPKFEMLAITEGVRLVEELGLKNVQIYSDSNTEARRIFLALQNIETAYYQQNKGLYEPIVKVLKNTNSSIAWIPREYNRHADELAKISLNAYIGKNDGQYKQKDYIKEHGYTVNKNEVIYFHQNKIQVKEHTALEHNFTVVVKEYNIRKEQYIISLLYDNENKKLSILEKTLIEPQYHKMKKDGFIIDQLCKILNNHDDNLKNINICVPQLVVAVNDKTIPIPSHLQENFFNFHKALHSYPEQLTMTSRWLKLNDKIKEYLDNYMGKFKNTTVKIK